MSNSSRSPGPRGATSPTSPLRHRLSGMNLESPSKSQCHKLPLPPGSPTSPPSVLPISRTCGVGENMPCTPSKWRKGRFLGRGAFGYVYLGFNSESGQMCAIKEVRVVSDDQTSKECLKQLNQDINLFSRLSHPNIVRYYGSDLGEETLSVYLEYISRGSIHKLLQEYGPLMEPVIQNYTRQILSGLAYLHGRNIVHRDIKGANILVDTNGEIKLVDFGMAKHITACGTMLSFKGSPYWMAPEVVMNKNGYNLAVDIWSLGCTILEMATSKPPWNQFEGVAAIFKIGNSKDIPKIADHLSNKAKSFIRLCLQREPSARPTVLQLLDHPFIRDQATTRVANMSITMDAFPYTFEGSQTLSILELQSSINGFLFYDGDYGTTRSGTTSRALRSPRSYPDSRGQGETSVNTGSQSPSPRGAIPTLPLHRLSGINLESPSKSQCHKSPLPPGSPTSPSFVLPISRTCGVGETMPCTPSKWQKVTLLGRGTFGHVYLGLNSESEQICAIKEVSVFSDDQPSKECLKQLNQEINLLSQLSHPNIVRYYGSYLGEETLSIYLDYVFGGSIHKLLQEYGAFREPVIQNYTRQILSGLAYLHGRNTVHRDIKGANILVDHNGEIKLADFGMAKHITACNRPLSFKGSPYWMAPEVVMKTNGYNLAVDIWSLGCTILEMATSKPPWNQFEGVAAIFKIGNSKDIPEIPDHLSNEAKSFIRLCLQREPSARPTVLQLLDHPFIGDQATTRVANMSITKDAFPYTFDGSRTLMSSPNSRGTQISYQRASVYSYQVQRASVLSSPMQRASVHSNQM